MAAGSDKNWNSGAACDEQRLVAEAVGIARWVDAFGRAGSSPVASRKHVDGYTVGGEQLGEADGEGSFSGAADGEIADADDRPA